MNILLNNTSTSSILSRIVYYSLYFIKIFCNLYTCSTICIFSRFNYPNIFWQILTLIKFGLVYFLVYLFRACLRTCDIIFYVLLFLFLFTLIFDSLLFLCFFDLNIFFAALEICLESMEFWVIKTVLHMKCQRHLFKYIFIECVIVILHI